MSECAEALRIADFDLIYGIGNLARQDDGLGWALLDELEGLYPQQRYLRSYQLFLEDVALLCDMERVLFVDACKRDFRSPLVPHAVIPEDLELGFAIEEIEGAMDLSFTSHAMSLPSVAAISMLCYQRCPRIWLLSVQGYQWELEQGLGARARENCNRALNFVIRCGIRAVGRPVFSGAKEPKESRAVGSSTEPETLLFKASAVS